MRNSIFNTATENTKEGLEKKVEILKKENESLRRTIAQLNNEIKNLYGKLAYYESDFYHKNGTELEFLFEKEKWNEK